MLPRDIDLTHSLDFNKREVIPKSIPLHKDKADKSYKRYNEYAHSSTKATISYTEDFELPNFTTVRGTTTISPFKLEWDTIKIEERVCFRKLYKDPSIYEQSKTLEEAVEYMKDLNFAMGSKEDRFKIHYEKLKMAENFGAGCYCDRCGKKLNHNNCLSYYYGLCQKCYSGVSYPVNSVRL